MGQIVVNVGSFDLTSHNGNTAYSQTRYFDIPANAGITACVATFAQHVNTGSFQGKAFMLNGAQAHPNTPWPTSGISLNPALLATGQNTFRASIKSQAGLSARWSIGDIYLTITYNDVGGGGGGYDIGTLSVDKTSMTAGDSLAVSVGAASAGVYRDISIFLLPSSAGLAYVAQGHGSGAGSWTVTIPESWCETYSPNDPMFEIRIYVDAYIAGGTPVGNTAKMVTVNVPASAVPTIGTFTATRNANGVDASITNYVQNYSKVHLLIDNVSGALGSVVQSYEITGGGFSAAASSVAFGPFVQTGDITFTAKATDTRGRTATKTVTINMLSYGPPAFSNPEAWRSSDTGVKNQKGTYAMLKSGVVYSSLGGQNSVTLKGMVHIKGGTVPAYTSMTPDTPWITGGGLLLVTKTYIARMLVEDLISARIVEFTIPTKKTGISIMAGMQGIAFGKSAEIPGVAEFAWPVYAENKLVITEAYKNEGTGYSSDSGFIINLKIPTSSAQNDWIFAEIVGGRDGDKPIFSQIQVNKYNTTWRSPIQKNYAYALPAAKFMELGGYIQLYIPSSPGILVVTVRSNNTVGRNPAPSVQAAASEPSGSNKVTCTIV